jgi:hypothetical protein
MAEDEPISLEPEEPISLDSDGNEQASASHQTLRTFGTAGARASQAAQFKRPLNVTGAGATRCRIFNSKIALPSIEAMQTKINQWLDSDTIDIKHVGQVIGTMEGKIPEPNLIVLVWY